MNISGKAIRMTVFLVALVVALTITKLVQIRLQVLSPASIEHVVQPPAGTATPVVYKVQQSSIDFSTRQSYLNLRLERAPGEAEPERLWVWAYYFSPDEPGRSWAGQPVEIRSPFANSAGGASTTVNITGLCPVCDRLPQGKKAYYTRVQISTESAASVYLPEATRDLDISMATPVLLQGTDKPVH